MAYGNHSQQSGIKWLALMLLLTACRFRRPTVPAGLFGRAVLAVTLGTFGLDFAHGAGCETVAGGPAEAALIEEGWQRVKERKRLCVYARKLNDSPIRQVMAKSIIEASPKAVLAAITDYPHYTEFMPYVAHSAVLKQEAGAQWVFQQLRFPWPISDRYFTIKLTVDDHSERGYYRVDWVLADEFQRKGDGEPTKENRGYWELRDPEDRPGTTHVVYFVHTDPGGKLPPWIANMANKRAVPKVIEALRQRVSER